MNDDMILEGELLAAGTKCPFPDCGALVIAYRPAMVEASNPNGLWEFTCPCCGAEFAGNDDLLFHSVPEKWLMAGFHSSNLAPGKPTFDHISDGDQHDEIYFEC